ASRSKTSHTNGSAPRWRSDSAFSGERVMPTTSCPAAPSSGTSRAPITPVAPATNTRMHRACLTSYVPCRGEARRDQPRRARGRRRRRSARLVRALLRPLVARSRRPGDGVRRHGRPVPRLRARPLAAARHRPPRRPRRRRQGLAAGGARGGRCAGLASALARLPRPVGQPRSGGRLPRRAVHEGAGGGAGDGHRQPREDREGEGGAARQRSYVRLTRALRGGMRISPMTYKSFAVGIVALLAFPLTAQAAGTQHAHWFAGSVTAASADSVSVDVLWTGKHDTQLAGKTVSVAIDSSTEIVYGKTKSSIAPGDLVRVRATASDATPPSLTAKRIHVNCNCHFLGGTVASIGDGSFSVLVART